MGNNIHVTELAALVNLSRSTVYRRLKDRGIDVRLGRVAQRDALRWLRFEQRHASHEWQERIDKVRAA